MSVHGRESLLLLGTILALSLVSEARAQTAAQKQGSGGVY